MIMLLNCALMICAADSLGTSTDPAEIVDAVQIAFEYFTQRAGGIPIPENIPTWNNLQFTSAVKRLDKVRFQASLWKWFGVGQRGRLAAVYAKINTQVAGLLSSFR